MSKLLFQPNYLQEASVAFLDDCDKNEALKSLLTSFACQMSSDIREDLLQKILDREEICSTGIGMAVALPHSKTSHLQEFQIAIGIHKQGLEWQSIDSIRVHYIFLIVGPEDKKEEYLELLRDLSGKLSNQQLLDKLFLAKTQQEVVKYLKTC